MHTPRSNVLIAHFWPTLIDASSKRLRSTRTTELSVMGWWIGVK